MFSIFGDIASACQQNFQTLKQQQNLLKTTISQVQDGKDKMALKYDLEALKNYNSAVQKLNSVSEAVYKDYSSVITQECDKEFITSLIQEGIVFSPQFKIPSLKELLDCYKTEISNQYVFTCWNTSDKLFDIRRDLSFYAYGLIYSGKCDDETVTLLSNAVKNSFIADKTLCTTSISELKNIIPNLQDKKVAIKASVMLKVSQKLYDNANKHISKGQVVPPAILYSITYEKLLETLKLCGFGYSKEMMQDTKDSDGDELPDTFELMFGTNPFKKDTDGDGLCDNIEYKVSKQCSPTLSDTDGDKIPDSKEDLDNDGLKNEEEAKYGTNLIKEDTDDDGLTDYFELNTSKTDPLKPDTDNDGLSDGDEYKLGSNPLVADSDGNGIPDGQEKFKQTIKVDFNTNIPNENNTVKNVTIDFESTGNAQSTTVVESVYGKSISSDVVGRLSYPFDIKTEATFSEATVSFSYDESALGGVSTDDLGVLWFDVDNGQYVLMDSTVNTANKTVSFKTTHFSEYLLINKKAWFDAWRQEINYGRKNDNSGKTQYYDIVLAIDSSGSMSWNDPDNLRKTAAKQFVDSFLPGDQGSVVDFDNSAIIKIHLTKNKDDIKASIDTIDSDGGTNIDIAVNTGIDELLSSNATNDNSKIIVLLTDGEGDYYSSTTKRAQDNNIKVYTVSIGADVDESLLGNIANDTGGKYYQIASSEDLLDAFKRVQDDTIGTIDTTDTDGDGLYDIVETTGFRTLTGEIIKTDPYNPDTDGDELSDGEEAGEYIVDSQSVSTSASPYLAVSTLGSTLAVSAISTMAYGSSSDPFATPFNNYYKLNSHPNKTDTDNDGYEDSEDVNPFVYNSPENQEFIADDMPVDQEIFWSFAWGVVSSIVNNGIDTVADVSTVINYLFGGTEFAKFTYVSLKQKKEDVIKYIEENKVTNETAYYFGRLVTDTALMVVGVIGTIEGLALFLGGGVGDLVGIGAEVFSGGTLTPAVAVEMAVATAVAAVGALEVGVSFSLAKNATVNSVDDGKKVVSSLFKKSNSQILRDNMKARAKSDPNFQKEPTYENAAHHMVPATAKLGKRAREILKKFDIDFNSADNGVFLPTKKGLPGAGSASVHKSRHLNKYINEVTSRLEQAKTREDALKILNTIRNDLLSGKLKLSKKWG
jgi:Mg-chelatase subunit ChlD